MNRILIYLKKSEITLPVWVGQLLSYIPFHYRPGIGSLYRKQKKTLHHFDAKTSKQQKEYIYESFYPLFKHAYCNIPFYKKLYTDAGISPTDIKSFEDIIKVPVISKKDLINVPLEERSFPIDNRAIVNTGGSSGTPFSFYMDPQRFGNEWAHVHYIWSHLGYKPNDLKLGFGGRSSVKDKIQYDPIRHNLAYDIYSDPILVNAKLLNIVKKRKVYYLHGYPSAVHNFALSCREHSPELLIELKKTLKGVFLVSEFPNPHFRNEISETFGVPTQSFYGHTETCVIAYEKQALFNFSVLQTYGYAEAVKTEQDDFYLVGTSYFNYASPLIRYNTEDIINEVIEDEGILNNFKIGRGRIGEFILDKNNNKIPLTGLIFGRHHKIFDLINYLQVYQSTPGKATILYVSEKLDTISANDNSLFDIDNVLIEFEFLKLDEPVLTSSGKFSLLVTELPKS